MYTELRLNPALVLGSPVKGVSASSPFLVRFGRLGLSAIQTRCVQNWTNVTNIINGTLLMLV